MKPLRIELEFPEDLSAAVHWYTEYAPAHADHFRAKIQQYLESIERFPESFPFVAKA